MRICRKCVAEFSGRRCGACHAAYNAIYNEKNRNRNRARARKYYEKNKDTRKAKQREYYQSNKEKVFSRVYAWQEKNPEKVKKSSLLWSRKHPELSRFCKDRWAHQHPDRIRVIRQNRRIRKKSGVGKLSPEIISSLISIQKGKCACCGLPLGEDFHVDHVIPLAKGGKHEDGNVQLLRKFCNLRKGTKLMHELQHGFR